MRRAPQRSKPFSDTTLLQHGSITIFNSEMAMAGSNDGANHQNGGQPNSGFSQLLFDRVVAKSHEDITDKDIQDLDLEMDNEDGDGDDSEQFSPQKQQQTGDTAYQEMIDTIQLQTMPASKVVNQKDQEEMLRLEMQLHAIQVKQFIGGSSPAVLNHGQFSHEIQSPPLQPNSMQQPMGLQQQTSQQLQFAPRPAPRPTYDSNQLLQQTHQIPLMTPVGTSKQLSADLPPHQDGTYQMPSTSDRSKINAANCDATSSLSSLVSLTSQDSQAMNRQDTKIYESKQHLMLLLQKIKDSDSVLIESKNKSLFLQTRSNRGSRYRGVSKNGTKWQVMIVRGEIKKYIGAVESEEIAARFYDKYALIIQGFEAKTNFSYTKREIEQLITSSDLHTESGAVLEQTSTGNGCAPYYANRSLVGGENKRMVVNPAAHMAPQSMVPHPQQNMPFQSQSVQQQQQHPHQAAHMGHQQQQQQQQQFIQAAPFTAAEQQQLQVMPQPLNRLCHVDRGATSFLSNENSNVLMGGGAHQQQQQQPAQQRLQQPMETQAQGYYQHAVNTNNMTMQQMSPQIQAHQQNQQAQQQLQMPQQMQQMYGVAAAAHHQQQSQINNGQGQANLYHQPGNGMAPQIVANVGVYGQAAAYTNQ